MIASRHSRETTHGKSHQKGPTKGSNHAGDPRNNQQIADARPTDSCGPGVGPRPHYRPAIIQVAGLFIAHTQKMTTIPADAKVPYRTEFRPAPALLVAEVSNPSPTLTFRNVAQYAGGSNRGYPSRTRPLPDQNRETSFATTIIGFGCPSVKARVAKSPRYCSAEMSIYGGPDIEPARTDAKSGVATLLQVGLPGVTRRHRRENPALALSAQRNGYVTPEPSAIVCVPNVPAIERALSLE